ncbi:MAG: UDP-3-O-(3-hydroxymyristoyl)glucosamine N-acyltransferase, partial [Candidatus Zixiibacteriota bacterium]
MNKQPVTLAELAKLVGGTVEGEPSTPIVAAAPIETAADGDISFVANKKYERYVDSTGASALVLSPDIPCTRVPVIRHPNPYLAFARILARLYPESRFLEAGVHTTAVVAESASVDRTAAVGPLCHLADNCRLGPGTQLVSDVYIGRDVTIGENCLLYPGVRIMDGT